MALGLYAEEEAKCCVITCIDGWCCYGGKEIEVYDVGVDGSWHVYTTTSVSFELLFRKMRSLQRIDLD